MADDASRIYGWQGVAVLVVNASRPGAVTCAACVAGIGRLRSRTGRWSLLPSLAAMDRPVPGPAATLRAQAPYTRQRGFHNEHPPYVLHCHNLEHEHMAMMAAFESV